MITEQWIKNALKSAEQQLSYLPPEAQKIVERYCNG